MRAEPGNSPSSVLAVWSRIVQGMLKEGLLIVAAWLLRRPSSLLRARWRFNCLLGEATEARIMERGGRTGARNVASMGTSYGETGERTSS